MSQNGNDSNTRRKMDCFEHVYNIEKHNDKINFRRQSKNKSLRRAQTFA